MELRHKYDLAILLNCMHMARSSFYYYSKQIGKTDKHFEVKEMIQKIKDRINHMKISLRHRQLSKERIRILENDLNCLTHDLIKAAKLSGLGYEVTESRKRF
jgi:hypothetical protein